MHRTLLILASIAALAGCGDSPSSSTDLAETPPDLSMAMSSEDLSPAGDLAPPPPDFTIPCTAEGSACSLPSGGLGICKAPGVGQPVMCQGCGTALDDAACIAAYGPGVAYLCESNQCIPGDCRTSTDCSAGKVCLNHFCSPCTGATDAEGDTRCKSDARYGATTLCLAGVCTVADCRTDADCAVAGSTPTKTRICGVVEANRCGGCVNDSQCQGSSDTTGSAGPNSMCEISTGACISRNCAAGGNSYCTTANPADVCCGTTCQTGNCCGVGGNVSCSSGGCSSTDPAKAGICTSCDAASGNTFYVDPVSGNDVTGTGATTSMGNAAPACAFRTVTRALQIIGGAPPVGTKIIVLGDSTVALRPAPEEKYPIRLPSNVEVRAMSGPIQINDNSAFSVVGTAVTIRGFKIATTVARSYGVEVQPGASLTTGALEISGFSVAGLVSRGRAFLGDGTSLKNNAGEGALATSRGLISVELRTTAPLGGVRFEGNMGYGASVIDQGELLLRGNGDARAPTVQVLNNRKGGVRVEPRAVAELRGLFIAGSTAASGVDVYPDSLVKIAESTILNNKLGVTVSQFGSATNLGSILIEESNVLQVSPGGPLAPNSVAGICLAAGHTALGTSPQRLFARRNVFAGPRDCRAASPGGLSSLSACSGARSDVAVVKLPNLTTPLLVVDNCTY
jgi:hypothetical protein